MKNKYYIGLASTFHDPSIAIIDQNGDILFAESTERYLQNKRAMGSPADTEVWIEKLIKEYCDDPFNAEFHIACTWSNNYLRLLKLYCSLGFLNFAPSKFTKKILDGAYKSMLPGENFVWFLNKQLASNIQTGANLERVLRWNFNNDNIKCHRFNHHITHAAYAAYSSHFSDATCLVVDGIGEKGSISYFKYENDILTPKGYHKGSESLGFFYTLITFLCGFNPIEGEEWKVMGLAAYGNKDEVYYSMLNSFLEIDDCNVRFKNKANLILRVIEKIQNDFKESDSNSLGKKANLAFTGQYLYSEYMIKLLNNLYNKGYSQNLTLSGGCALNSSFNGKILTDTKFKDLFVPSAPGDDGSSVGAAYLALKDDIPFIKISKGKILSPYLGSKILNSDIENFIKFSGNNKVQKFPNTIAYEAAKYLSQGKLVGWVQGRAEFGPRALGNRSILADPRSLNMKDIINSKVKFREEFRPFAPSILREFGSEYFENYQDSPYMERTLKFKDNKRDEVPAVVHVDQTGRLQSVDKKWNPLYYSLIEHFYNLTNVPLILNTSFNVMGKPIIHSFQDALNVFYNSGLDVLIVNDHLILK